MKSLTEGISRQGGNGTETLRDWMEWTRLFIISMRWDVRAMILSFFFLPLTSSVPANNGIRYYSEKKNTWEKTMIRSHGFEIRNFNIYAFAIAVKNESTPRLVLWFLTRETTMQTIWFWDMSEIFFRRFYIHTLLFLSTVFFRISASSSWFPMTDLAVVKTPLSSFYIVRLKLNLDAISILLGSLALKSYVI